MIKKYLILLMVSSIAGCASLTKTQILAVNHFAQVSKDFSQYPSKVMTGLADIRADRGVFFANSLDNPRLHIQELDSIYSFKKCDYVISEKVDITFQIIDKYAQSLLLLSSEKHGNSLHEKGLNFGADLDSLTSTYNSMSNVKRVPTSIGGAIGQLLALGGKQYVRLKQAREIKKFVPAADELIEVMTDNLLEFLQSANIKDLIKNEEVGVNSSYLSYLRQVKTVSSAVINNDTTEFAFNTRSTVPNDHAYLNLKMRVDAVISLRDGTVVATKALRKAHKKLLTAIQTRQKLTALIPEVQELYVGIRKLKKSIAIIEKPKNNSYEGTER